jgi:uncharacterized protein YceK
MIKIFNLAAATAIAFFLTGCGTINTVFYEDSVTSNNLRKLKTNCNSIPRAYSGVFYDFCILNGPPSELPNGITIGQIPLPVLDFIPSGIVDTLILPYSIYQQTMHGSIEI